jgi:hypothetical protein
MYRMRARFLFVAKQNVPRAPPVMELQNMVHVLLVQTDSLCRAGPVPPVNQAILSSVESVQKITPYLAFTRRNVSSGQPEPVVF